MSPTVSRTVTVERAVDAVATYLADIPASAEWIPHHVSCTALDDGPVRVGARYRTVARVGPLTETIEQVVTAHDGGRLVLEGRSRFLRTRDELVVTAAGSGTAVTYTAEVELVGRARVAAPTLAPFMAATADQGARRLRAALLAGVPETAPHAG